MSEQVARISGSKACELLQSEDYDIDVKKNSEGKFVMNLEDAEYLLSSDDYVEETWTPFFETMTLSVGIPVPKRRKAK